MQDVAGQSVAILQVFAAMDALKMNDLSSFCIGDGPTHRKPFNGHMNSYKVGSIGTAVGTSGRSVGRRKDRN